jgi:hypothetical protein
VERCLHGGNVTIPSRILMHPARPTNGDNANRRRSGSRALGFTHRCGRSAQRFVGDNRVENARNYYQALISPSLLAALLIGTEWNVKLNDVNACRGYSEKFFRRDLDRNFSCLPFPLRNNIINQSSIFHGRHFDGEMRSKYRHTWARQLSGSPRR